MFEKLLTVTPEDLTVTCCSFALKHVVAVLQIILIVLSFLSIFSGGHQVVAAIVALIWYVVGFVGFAEEQKIVMMVHVIVNFIGNIFFTIALFIFSVLFAFGVVSITHIGQSGMLISLVILIYLVAFGILAFQCYYTWMCYQLVKIVNSKTLSPPVTRLA